MSDRWESRTELDNRGRSLPVWMWGDYELCENVNLGLEGGWVTCFNGLYRVNRRGEVNVPMGRYVAPKILDADGLRASSVRLHSAELDVGSFESVLHLVQPGDFVYLDPPYVPLSATSNFASYAADGFGAQDQLRLREVFAELTRRGIHAMASNSDTPGVRALYKRWDIRRVRARRSVGCTAGSRGGVNEVVIRNYA